jgi:hypothetical protein
VDDLPLKVVHFDQVEIRQAKHTHAGGGQVKSRRAAQTTRADHQHPGGRQLALTGDTDLLKQNLPTVATEFLGRQTWWTFRHDQNARPDSANCVQSRGFRNCICASTAAGRRQKL